VLQELKSFAKKVRSNQKIRHYSDKNTARNVGTVD